MTAFTLWLLVVFSNTRNYLTGRLTEIKVVKTYMPSLASLLSYAPLGDFLLVPFH